MTKSMVCLMVLLLLFPLASSAQKGPAVLIVKKSKGKPDSVVVKVGKSRIAVIIRDTSDLDALRHFDVQELVDDMIEAAVEGDTAGVGRQSKYLKQMTERILESQEKILREQEDLIREAEEMARRRGGDNRNDGLREREQELHRRLRELADRERELLELNRRSLYMHRDFSVDKWKDILQEGFELDIDRLRDDEDSDHDEDRGECDDCDDHENGKEYRKTTYQSFNMDFGMNNYLAGGKFVDADNAPYTVRPLGSWYVGANQVYRTRLARKFFLEWGVGGGIYNFKFQNDSIRINRSATGISFVNDTREADFRKSKLVAGYLMASMVPVIDFGGNPHKPGRFDDHRARSFRFGVGPYVGYRVLGYTKQYYRIDGDKKRERDHDNYYLNNLRYGLRAQVGFRDTDLFFCYDLNEVFSKGKGPALNAFSFGISF